MSTASGIPVDFRRASFTRSRKEKIIMKALETMIQNMFHKDCAACTDQEVYEALLTYTKEQLAAKGYHDGKKKIYYISAEFLIGKLLSNNLINLGIYDEVAEFLKKMANLLQKLNPLSRNHLLEMVVLDVWLHVSWILLQHLDFLEKVLV